MPRIASLRSADRRRPRLGAAGIVVARHPVGSSPWRHRTLAGENSGRFLIGNVDFRFDALAWWSTTRDGHPDPAAPASTTNRTPARWRARRS